MHNRIMKALATAGAIVLGLGLSLVTATSAQATTDPIYVEVSIEISPATCDVGEVASVNLDTLNHGEVTSTSGLTGPGTYSITITADPDAQFGPDGALGGSKTFTGPLAGPLDCPDDPAPPVDSADPPTTTDKVLASTGLGDINPWVPIGAAIIVMIGIPMAVFAYRRYKTESVTAE